MHRTTEKDFAEFQRQVKYWIEHFGLKNWEFEFFYEPNDENARAAYQGDGEGGGVASIGFSTKWNTEPTKAEIKKAAHIMVAPLSVITRETKPHDIVKKLENTVFKEKREEQ